MTNEFRTTFPIDKKLNISYNDNILLIGSCFSENIGNILTQLQFNTLVNPYGILYNPYSIETMIKEISEEKQYKHNDLVFFNDKWLSFNHHGIFSDFEAARSLMKINSSILEAHDFICNADYIFLTLGTSIVYFNIDNDYPVGNCHKFPSNQFYQRRLSLDETVESLNRIINYIRNLKEDLQIILTISPIRHWKNGAVENQRSKSTLIIAVDEVCSSNEDVFYFPAYEIIMDDLRDYRFYSEDMLHLNNVAIDYIWKKFKENYINESSYELIKEIEKLNKALQHRVEKSEGIEYIKYQEYIEQQRNKVAKMRNEFI
ncbi:MAG: GSCFA domain-containing protein [Bacteroidales bacterium]|jgi:hypothetical protein|nr:GSCFA domain-containing protein [Bacteroidales bacterium]